MIIISVVVFIILQNKNTGTLARTTNKFYKQTV